MRIIATLLLALMTLIFAVTTIIKVDWAWVPYVRAFAEAGMVGACADWFAVVALFRRPFGLPIPHTGIVPNNKERIGGALGRFITNNFLTAKVTSEKFAQVDIVGWIATWISDPDNSKRVAHYTAQFTRRIAKSLPSAKLGEFFGSLARQGIESIPAAPMASKLLAIVWAHGEVQILLDRVIDLGEVALANNRDYITRKVAEQSTRWIPKWVDQMIAEKVMNGLLNTLAQMRNPDHPWRIELRNTVHRLIHDLATDPQMYKQGEALKAELLANPLFLEQAKTLWAEVESGLYSDIQTQAGTISRLCEIGMQSIGAWLQSDMARQAQLNRRIRVTAQRSLLPYRVQIGAYIERVVRDWDSTTLVNRLELQVGKDLQYIRINGTLVGGLVGLLIFIVSKWIAAF